MGRRGPKFRAFFPLPPQFSLFLLSLGGPFVEFWWCFGSDRALKCARLEFSGCPEADGVSHDNSRAQTCTFEGPGLLRKLLLMSCFVGWTSLRRPTPVQRQPTPRPPLWDRCVCRCCVCQDFRGCVQILGTPRDPPSGGRMLDLGQFDSCQFGLFRLRPIRVSTFFGRLWPIQLRPIRTNRCVSAVCVCVCYVCVLNK